MDSGRRRGRSFHENENEDNGMQFITPQFNGIVNDISSTTDRSLDPSQLIIDDDSKADNDDEEYVDDEDVCSRGRSRSRSVHQMDENTNNIVPVQIDTSSINNNNDNINNSNNDTNKTDKLERSGPLQQREVLVLKKGLEEATQHRNRDQLREEEEEKRAAESERKQRQTTLQAPLALGADPHMRRIKLLILGDSGVGKSSLINRWTADIFTPSLVGTVGVNFKTKKIQKDSEYIQVQVWDTAGQEQFHKITTSYYKGAHGILLVYDVSDKKTVENIGYWVKNIKSHATDTVQVALVGNKSDLRNADTADKCCDPEIGKSYSSKYSVPYYETSAKDATNVDMAFMTLVDNVIAADPTNKGNKSPIIPIQKGRQSIVEKAGEKMSLFTSFNNTKLSTVFHSSSGSNGTNNSSSPSSSSTDKEKCFIS